MRAFHWGGGCNEERGSLGGLPIAQWGNERGTELHSLSAPLTIDLIGRSGTFAANAAPEKIHSRPFCE